MRWFARQYQRPVRLAPERRVSLHISETLSSQCPDSPCLGSRPGSNPTRTAPAAHSVPARPPIGSRLALALCATAPWKDNSGFRAKESVRTRVAQRPGDGSRVCDQRSQRLAMARRSGRRLQWVCRARAGLSFSSSSGSAAAVPTMTSRPASSARLHPAPASSPSQPNIRGERDHPLARAEGLGSCGWSRCGRPAHPRLVNAMRTNSLRLAIRLSRGLSEEGCVPDGAPFFGEWRH
jgi:hypothetical protein